MDQCSKRHAIPPAITINPTNRPAHDLGVELEVLRLSVLTSQRLTTTLTERSIKVVDSH